MDTEEDVVTTHTINVAPDPLGLWRWISCMNESSLNAEATTEAVKLWMLTAAFPFAKASTLLLIVKGCTKRRLSRREIASPNALSKVYSSSPPREGRARGVGVTPVMQG